MLAGGHNFQLKSAAFTKIVFPYLHITSLHFLSHKKWFRTILIFLPVLYEHTVMLILKELNLVPCMLSS